MKYVLIVVLSAWSGGAATSAEFNSLDACEAARAEVVADARANEKYVIVADCFEKGR